MQLRVPLLRKTWLYVLKNSANLYSSQHNRSSHDMDNTCEKCYYYNKMNEFVDYIQRQI